MTAPHIAHGLPGVAFANRVHSAWRQKSPTCGSHPRKAYMGRRFVFRSVVYEVSAVTCHPEVVDVLCEILRIGLLQARAFGWNGDARRCAIEADHLHNLPALLADFSENGLRYYWDAERPSYVSQVGPEGATAFEVLWHRLEQHVVKNPIATGAA